MNYLAITRLVNFVQYKQGESEKPKKVAKKIYRVFWEGRSCVCKNIKSGGYLENGGELRNFLLYYFRCEMMSSIHGPLATFF